MSEPAREDHASTVRDSLSTNVVASIAAHVGYMVTRFFIPPFVLAHISLESYGLWATAFIVVSYIGISTMGLSAVYMKYVAEYAARRDFARANQLLSTGLCVSIPVCGAVFGVLWLLWPRVVAWLNVSPALRADAREVVLTVVAVFLASISLSAFHDALVGVQKSAVVQVTWAVSYLAEAALIFFLVGGGRGVRGLAEAFLIRTAIDVFLCVVLSIRMLKWLRVSPALCTRDSLKILLSFGGVVQIQSLIAVALNSIERAIAAPLAGLAATGLLDLGQKLPSMSANIPYAMASAFVPAASYLHGGLSGSPEQREAIRKLYLKGARYMNLSTAWICALLVVMPGPILDTWVGKHYAGAPYLMVVFAIAFQFHLMTGPGTSIFKGIGLPKEEFHYCIPNILALCVTVPLSYLIEGKWDAIGIGTAVATATVVSAIYFVQHANRIVGVSSRTYLGRVVLPGIVPYLVAAPPAFLAYLAVAHTNRWVAAACIATIGGTYSAALLVITARFVFDTGERLWFQAVLAKRLSRFLPARAASRNG